MSSKTLLICIFCSLLSNATRAQETIRKTIQLSFPTDSAGESIKTNLDKLGII